MKCQVSLLSYYLLLELHLTRLKCDVWNLLFLPYVFFASVKTNCRKIKDCYVVKTQPAKWLEARSKCEAEGFRLAKISNIIENDAIKSLLQGASQAWIGLERRKNFCLTSKTSYRNWDFHEPNDKGLMENCVAIGDKGKWSDEDCNSSLAVICKRGIVLKCCWQTTQ